MMLKIVLTSMARQGVTPSAASGLQRRGGRVEGSKNSIGGLLP